MDWIEVQAPLCIKWGSDRRSIRKFGGWPWNIYTGATLPNQLQNQKKKKTKNQKNHEKTQRLFYVLTNRWQPFLSGFISLGETRICYWLVNRRLCQLSKNLKSDVVLPLTLLNPMKCLMPWKPQMDVDLWPLTGKDEWISKQQRVCWSIARWLNLSHIVSGVLQKLNK